MMDDSSLNALLRELGPEQPTSALCDRILAAAPASRPGVDGRLWWTLGAGWAAAAAAGLVLGATLSSAPAGSDVDQAFAVEEELWPEDLG